MTTVGLQIAVGVGWGWAVASAPLMGISLVFAMGVFTAGRPCVPAGTVVSLGRPYVSPAVCAALVSLCTAHPPNKPSC